MLPTSNEAESEDTQYVFDDAVTFSPEGRLLTDHLSWQTGKGVFFTRQTMSSFALYSSPKVCLSSLRRPC